MDRRMMFIGDDGVARPFVGEDEMVDAIEVAIKDGPFGAERKALMCEVKEARQVDLMVAERKIDILRGLVSYFRAWTDDLGCTCDARYNVMCSRCAMLGRIDSALGSLSQERDGG